jgi:hypothetical protein
MGSSSDAEPMREGEAGIDSFQEPVERVVPCIRSFPKIVNECIKDFIECLGSFQTNPMLSPIRFSRKSWLLTKASHKTYH